MRSSPKKSVPQMHSGGSEEWEQLNVETLAHLFPSPLSLLYLMGEALCDEENNSICFTSFYGDVE